jgi:hypothetical protein
MKKKVIYAVAATLTKHVPNGLNIQTYIQKYEVASEVEAIGTFVMETAKKFPEHDIHVRPVVICLSNRR